MRKISSDENQEGFTLIEIITVLIILGILAAVAVPKLMDITADARGKAMKGAIAEGMATMSAAYAKLMLEGGSATTGEIAGYATSNPPASDEFSYAFTAGGLVTVSGRVGSGFQGAPSVTKTWVKP